MCLDKNGFGSFVAIGRITVKLKHKQIAMKITKNTFGEVGLWCVPPNTDDRNSNHREWIHRMQVWD